MANEYERLLSEKGVVEPQPIIVWAFGDAPDELRDLSARGGDEDWIAEIPSSYGYIGWLEQGSPFGCYKVEQHNHPTKAGWVVRIGSHA